MGERLKILDLCSGIGGFTLGFEAVGFRTIAFCEIEPYCRGVLEKHWPGIPIYEDIKQLSADRLRADGIVPDIICGGYPCQPFSVAGYRRGKEDDRHLWPFIIPLVAGLRPTWCVFENVYGHISMGIDDVLDDLVSEGYAARTFVLPALAVDAKHRRDRVWIIARNVADTSIERCQRSSTKPIHGFRDLSPQFEGSGSNVQDGWPPEPGVGRVADGISNRAHRTKGLGNAIVPQIVTQIGKIINECEQHHSRKRHR